MSQQVDLDGTYWVAVAKLATGLRD